MKRPNRNFTQFGFLVLLTTLMSSSIGCAYRLGQGSRGLPGGYTQMSIPMFKNRSQEVGVEVAFTQALQQEFLRSKVARVVSDPLAEVRVEGVIVSIHYRPGNPRVADSTSPFLPKGTVIASNYEIEAIVNVRLIRRSDNELLWAAERSYRRTYSAPQVTLSGVNSVNPLYNLSARRQNLDAMANDIMVEVHGGMTENF